MKVGLTIYFKFASSTPTDAFRPILIEEIGCDSVEGSENLKSFGKLKSLWNSIGTFRIMAWFRYCLGIVSKTLAYLTTLTFSHISDLNSSNPVSPEETSVNTQEKYPDDNWIEKHGSGELKFNMNL